MGTCNILFFLSGAAALGYEVVATRLFGLGLGCETASTLAVVGAFMAGTGIGAWMGDRPVRRTPEPAHLYGLYQLTFGIWAIASLIAIPWLCDRARVWVGANPDPLRQWGIVFLTVTAALLPATAATGASLQAMEQLCSRLSRDGRTIPGLYAANTAGAVAGILGAALLSAPLGFRRTLLACGALSLICAIGAARLIFKVSGLPARTYQMADPPSGRRLAITLFATGFLGIAYEVLVIRSLSLVLSNTFYTFAITLAVYLLGTSAGAAVYARTGPKRTKPGAHSDVTEKSSRGFLTGLVAGLAACCAGALHLLPQAGRFQTALAAAFGGGQGAEAASEFATAALVLFLPAAFMGATFSHLAQMAAPGRGVGWALAVNTLGGALAPPLVAVGLVPWIGVKSALAGQTLCYLALLPNAALRRAWPALVAIALIITAPVQWGLMSAPPGGRVLAQRDGALATTLVVADHAGHRYLKLHSRLIDGGTQSTFGERRMAHIPLLFHPDPRRALCLGVGSGMTVGAAAMHPAVMVTGVELHPEVLDVLPFFYPENGPAGAVRWHSPGPSAHAGAQPSTTPRLNLVTSDARRFVLTTAERYDVIIGDLFHPASDGTAALFTTEHFRAIRERLAPGGLFCQWLPLHELDLELVRSLAATFTAVFPHSVALMAHFNAQTPAMGLVGFEGNNAAPLSHSSEWYVKRVPAALLPRLTECGLGNDLALLGCLLCDSESLSRLCADAPINTDDHQRLLFMAPRVSATASGRSGALGPATLAALLGALHSDPRSIVARTDPFASEAFMTRLSSYLRARDVYLRGDIARVEGRPIEALAAYTESARLSSDFAPGFSAARLFAGLLMESDPARAQAALDTLAALTAGHPAGLH